MQDEQKPRESIWSVPAGWLRIYLTLFVIETSVCLGLIIWHEITTREPGDNFAAVLIAVGGSMAPLILTIATANVGLVEVTYMLDRLIGERYRQHRYKVGRREAEAEAQQAMAEAQAKAQRRLDEWNARRLAAQAAGEPFTEPPPSLYSPNGKSDQSE